MSFLFRFVEVSDADAILSIYAPYCSETPISFERMAPDRDEMQRRIQTCSLQFPWVVCEENGQIAGYAYATRYREREAYQWSVEVTVYISPTFQRRGLGRALYSRLFHILRLQNYRMAFAGIALPNPGSEGLHRSLGFQEIGIYRNVGYKLGSWHDVLWLQLELQSPAGEPKPPEAIGAVRDSEVIARILSDGAIL